MLIREMQQMYIVHWSSQQMFRHLEQAKLNLKVEKSHTTQHNKITNNNNNSVKKVETKGSTNYFLLFFFSIICFTFLVYVHCIVHSLAVGFDFNFIQMMRIISILTEKKNSE